MGEAAPQGGAVPGATLLGELVRGGARWDVYLETAPAEDGPLVRGRLHFAQAERRRASAWIFLERGEREVAARVGEFSSIELWALLESLAP